MTKSSAGMGSATDDLRRILRGALKENEPMRRHTTIGVGGNATLFAEPETVAQLARTVRYATERGIDYVVVGKGSNLIVRDRGFEGLVIKLVTNLARVRINRRTVNAEAGASFAPLSRKMTSLGRTGLEFGIGIPGSVGGVVKMNAGAFGGEVRDVLRRVRIVEATGEVRSVLASEIEFGYRRTNLPATSVVASATFACPAGEVRRDVYERSVGRKHTQPIWERSFGSTFVNPAGGYAAEMIEGCGLKGMRCGGAMVSNMHANFVINVDGDASAADVEHLIELMRSKVKERYNVDLKTEVVIIGNR